MSKIIITIVLVIIAIALGYGIYQLMTTSKGLTEKEQACVSSGGTVSTSLCCKATEDFPNSCSIGACGCSPTNSHQVKICDCGPDKCFDGTECLASDEALALLEDLTVEELSLCAKEGEQFSQVYEEYPEHCCEGLKEWHSGFDTSISIADERYETGLAAGYPVGTCIKCGDGICGDIENPCNCPEDCIGKGKSDFLSVEEFCQSEDWNQTFSRACEETTRGFPMCELCTL